MSYRLLKINGAKLKALTDYWRGKGEKYGLGSKIAPLSGFTDADGKVDCSGWARYLIQHATNETGSPVVIPDGSVQQHDWIKAQGFEPCSIEDGGKVDGRTRIAFLAPEPIGHVTLIFNGWTYESHGGVGPDSRRWGSQAWMGRTKVYVLAVEAA